MGKNVLIALCLISILCMSGCNAENNAGVSEMTSEVISQSAETTAVETVQDTASETTMETTSVTTTEDIAESAPKISTDDFEYRTADVIETETDISAEWLAAARECLKGNERYDYFAEYSVNAAHDVELVTFEDYIDENGSPKAKFKSAVIDDFNGDGQQEGFIVLETPYIFTEVPSETGGNNFVVYINDKGSAALAVQGYEALLDGQLAYGDISHMCVLMGANNASNRSMIFSTADGAVKEEFSYNWSVIIDDENNRIIKDTQISTDTYYGVKWDCEKECYIDITVATDELF